MNISIQWDPLIPHTLLVTFPEQWVWSDFYTVHHQAVVMLRDRPNRCGVIQDLRAFDTLPPGALRHMNLLVSGLPPQVEVTALVGMARHTRIIWQTFTRVTPGLSSQRFVTTDSLDKARAIVLQRLEALS